jgi:acyl carrier protein
MEATTQQIEEGIRRFILTDVLELPGDASLPADANLLSGLLDSFGLVSLLAYLEETYDIRIDNTEVVDEHFGTISAAARLVEAKRQDRGSAGAPAPVAAENEPS